MGDARSAHGRRSEAEKDAERLRGRALRSELLHQIRGIPNELVPFDAVRGLGPVAESYGGVRAIPLERIVGSVDRYRDFDQAFLPRWRRPLDRWIGIRQARLEGVELPAIQVYEAGGVYFVKDGHHRVSVARRMGQRFIDAEIVALSLPVGLEPDDTLHDLVLKGEYARFLEVSGLARVRPDHREVLFTVTGRYEVVLEHVRTHRWFLGLELGREPSREEAVASWHDRIYAPVVDAVAQGRALRRFPGRRPADLYVWIMDHRWFLRERLGTDPGSEAATWDYAARHAPALPVRLWQRFRTAWTRRPPGRGA